MPETQTAQPRYQRVADALIQDIRSGQLAVGTKMPGELELRERFGVSRHTVREALRMLESSGIVSRHQGIGTVVLTRDSSPVYINRVHSPSELLQYPQDTRLTIRGSQLIVANRRLGRLLGSRPGSEWLRVTGIRRIVESGLPICWTEIYLLPELGTIVEQLGQHAQPVYELIARRFNEQVQNVSLDIKAEAIDTARAPALEVEPGAPALTVVRRYIGRDRGLFEVSVSTHPADRFTYNLNLKRGWQAGS